MTYKHLLLFSACVGLAPLAFAAQPSPTDPAAPASPARYESAFDGYRSYKEEPIADWRGVNNEVGQIGGHMGIFRGTGGHAGHGAQKAAPEAVRTPVPAETGQQPARSAPKAPSVQGHRH